MFFVKSIFGGTSSGNPQVEGDAATPAPLSTTVVPAAASVGLQQVLICNLINILVLLTEELTRE